MEFKYILMFCACLCVVLSKPLDFKDYSISESRSPRLWKRFINPAVIGGDYNTHGYFKMRTRRSTLDDCEKLHLCKLHSRSNRNFFSAYELYFVNKENARLWDHQARSPEECERRFSGCYGDQPRAQQKQLRYDYEDFE